jgi:uncharacterized membrane protein
MKRFGVRVPRRASEVPGKSESFERADADFAKRVPNMSPRRRIEFPRVRRLFGPVFMFAGIMHFVIPRTYESIVPDYLPARRALVCASGVAEIAGGAGVSAESVGHR